MGKPLGDLDGVPIAIKDNILIKGVESTAASYVLDGFKSPVDATVVARLKQQGAIIIGSANMDEFGMGSYGKYGKGGTRVPNPIDIRYYAGGSSAGSAQTVKLYQAMGSLGTDTGGSIGQPAH